MTIPPRALRKRMGRPPATDDPRGTILQAAARLFAEKGYEASSLGELAERACTSKAGVYHYFATKQQIYDAIILHVLGGLVQAVQAAVAQHQGAQQRLEAFMVAHAGFFEANYHGFVVMLTAFGGMAAPDLKQEAVRLRDAHEQLLRDIVHEGMRNGEFSPALDVAQTGRAVLSMLNWMVRWFRPGAGDSARQVAGAYFHLLLGGLTNKPEPRPQHSP